MKMLLLTFTCYENVVVDFLLVMKMLLCVENTVVDFLLVMKMLLLTFYLL